MSMALTSGIEHTTTNTWKCAQSVPGFLAFLDLVSFVHPTLVLTLAHNVGLLIAWESGSPQNKRERKVAELR